MGFCWIPIITSLWNASFGILFFLFLASSRFPSAASDAIDLYGNITIKWDVINWTSDGYVALVTMHNFQQYRHFAAPGWTLGWTWAKNEAIWSIVGGQATERGNCSEFKGNIPNCCKKDPAIVDLLPGAPYNQKIAHCCKGGVLSSLAQDPTNAVASFQLSVGRAGTTNRTIRLPKNFTLKAPGPGYTCGKLIKIVLAVSPFLLFIYNDTIIPCPSCSCGCRGNSSSCAESDSPHLAPSIQCTSHMCPIQVHWHVKGNDKGSWRVKINVTNFNYRTNYSDWNLLVQHPNVDNLTQLSGSNYKGLASYGATANDTVMIWGIKFYNDFLNQAGPSGDVQLELVFRKDNSTFALDKSWAFPRRIFFNGDMCETPQPDAYPLLANASSPQQISVLALLMMSCLVALVFYTFP